jgi:hypothetical protein
METITTVETTAAETSPMETATAEAAPTVTASAPAVATCPSCLSERERSDAY